MATRSMFSQNDYLAARQALQPIEGQGRLGGFRNMFGKELGEWFGTRRWLVQLLLWLVLVNGMVAFMIFVLPVIDPGGLQAGEGMPAGPDLLLTIGLTMYFSVVVVAGSIAAVILVQDEVIREKQSGTAAWVLSKPVGRATFILTKLFSNLIGVLVFIVALPGLVAYTEISLAQVGALAPLRFIAGAGVALLALVFYIALTILLGATFEQRGPVLGVAFGLLFGGAIVSSLFPQAAYVLPLSMDKIALAVTLGQPLPAMAISQLISTAALSAVFTGVGLWRFNREEF